MPMDAYLDESGIHAGAERCVVAGVCGGRRKCKEFEAQWGRLLTSFNIPADEGFHGKDFFGRNKLGERRGIYRNWSGSQTSDFIEAAVDGMKRLHLHPIGSAINVKDFNALSPNMRRWLTGGEYDPLKGKWLSSGAPSKPWFFVFHDALVRACKMADTGVTIDFIFDRQDEFCGLARNSWSKLKKQPTRTAAHLGSIEFYSRFERVTLQAADLVAHSLYYKETYCYETSNSMIRYAIHRLLNASLLAVDLTKAISLLGNVYPERLKEEDALLSKV